MWKGKLLQLTSYNQAAAPRASSGSLDKFISSYSNRGISSHSYSLCFFRSLCGLSFQVLLQLAAWLVLWWSLILRGWSQHDVRLRTRCLQLQGGREPGNGKSSNQQCQHHWVRSTSQRGEWFDGGRRWKNGAKLNFVSIGLCKKNIRRMLRISK